MAGLTTTTDRRHIVMANSSSHLGAAAIKVLARQAAIKAVKCELVRRGIAHVPLRDIHICADEYLRHHPELIGEARDRAERLGLYERKPSCQLVR